MLNRLQKLKEQKDGFTIIEVLIVLAIAGLIMVVVFLAVPNLQKSQRNNARDTDANNLLQSVSSYIGNANGSLPTACSTSACTWITYKPQQLSNYKFQVGGSAPSAGSLNSDGKNDTAVLLSGFVCNGVTPTTTNAVARDYVVYYTIEGSTATKCTQGS